MLRRVIRRLVLLATVVAAGAAAPTAAAYIKLAPGEFARISALDEPLSVAQLDKELLAAAIFHETNRVRSQLGLKPFRGDEPLDSAAETQADIGSLFRPPSHTNPFLFIATPVDRVRQAGLDPSLVAENIALISVFNIPSGTGLFQLKDDPRFRDVRTGEPAGLHTYRSYAVNVVEEWMNSPGHRANIVNPRFQFLGCAVRETKSLTGIDMVFAVQVFHTPKTKRLFRRN